MTAKIGTRWILAVVQTAFFVVCFAIGNPEYDRAWREIAEHGEPISDYQPPYPLSLKLAFGINLPAFVPAAGTIVFAHSLGIKKAMSDPISVPVISVWVAFFWFYCGLWVDRRLGC